jgi:hypothetical protein
MANRNYKAGVVEALHLLSGGSCYYPGCGEPTIRFRDGAPKKNVVVAHIHALEDDGPRAIKTMPEPERNAYPNLILLCHPCHDIVDHNVKNHPAALLKQWKANREKEPRGSLAGLRNLDQATMETLLNKAMSEVREDMAAVASTFPELAQLLRGVMEHLPQLDPKSIGLLHEAATNLRELPDSAMILHQATRHLPDLPDGALILHDAARHLPDLPDGAMILHAAAEKLSELPDHASSLHAAADKLVNLPDHVTYLQQVAETWKRTISNSTTQLSEAVGQLESVFVAIPTPAQPAAPRSSAVHPTTTVPVKPEWYWKGMVAGWAGWACFAFTMLIVWLNAKGN